MTHLRLQTSLPNRTLDGRGHIVTVHTSLRTVRTFPDGLVVEMPIPFLPVDGEAPLVLLAKTEVSGAAGVLVDCERWTPAWMAHPDPQSFPLTFPDRETALRVGRAFRDDVAAGSVSWTDPHEVIFAWLLTWGAANNLDFQAPTGGDKDAAS